MPLMVTAFHFVQMLFWVALSTWFGGVLFVAAASRVVFQTVRETDPILPTVLSVNLEGQHGTLLAGSIMANLLSMLRTVELYCAGGLFLALVAQWLIVDPARNWLIHTVRSALFVAAVAIVLYDWRSVAPQIRKSRQEYIDHADEPEVANPAKERFDHFHKESITLLMFQVALLLGIVFFSAALPGPNTSEAAFVAK
jgi:hypothetical protein